jgi:hypothetical protein
MNASRKCYDIEKTKMILFFLFSSAVVDDLKVFRLNTFLPAIEDGKKYLNKFSVFNSVLAELAYLMLITRQTWLKFCDKFSLYSLTVNPG